MSDRGSEGEEKGRNRDSSRLTQVPRPISLSSLAFLTSQIMCIQHSFLASCLLAMCCFFFCAYCWSKSETEGTLSEFICLKKYQPNTKIWLTLTKSHPRQVQYLQLCLLQWFLWQVFISIQHKLMGSTEMQSSGTKGFFKGRGTEKRWLYGLPLYLFHFVPLSFGRKDWFFFLPCCLSRGRICPY